MADQYMKYCSFCGKGEDIVSTMFSAGDVNICDECISYCYEMIYGSEVAARTSSSGRKKKSSNGKAGEIHLLKPAAIKSVLDEYVIGQDAAKMSLSVAVYNHYKRILSQDDGEDVELQKSNVLLLGPWHGFWMCRLQLPMPPPLQKPVMSAMMWRTCWYVCFRQQILT
jgi:ATP-dependent Clp protease ATP-binding subunit ClpX